MFLAPMSLRTGVRGAVGLVIVTFIGAACREEPVTPQTSPRLVVLSGDGQSAEVGTIVPEPVVFRVTDRSGEPVNGVVIRYAGSTLSDSVRTDADGIARARFPVGRQAAQYYYRASAIVDEVVTGVTFTVRATPGAPALTTILDADSAVALPLTVLDTLVVELVDSLGNLVPGVSVQWQVTAGGGWIRAASAASDSRGRVRAVWQLGPDVGANLLTLTAGRASRQLTATAHVAFDAATIAMGDSHTCALTVAEAVYCWGSNYARQLGASLSKLTVSKSPVRVTTDVVLDTLVAGGSHTCGLSHDGSAWCWGMGQPRVTMIPGNLEFVAMAAGAAHTCGLTRNQGRVYCWGDNAMGQLGRRDVAFTRDPLPVASELRFTALAAGGSFTCGIAQDGGAWCWGSNISGELGADAPKDCAVEDFYGYDTYLVPCSRTPLRVTAAERLTSLVSGSHGSCGLTSDGEFRCWGQGSESSWFLGGSRGLTQLAMGPGSACALDAMGRVSCWSLAPAAHSMPPQRLDTRIAFSSLAGGPSGYCGVASGTTGVVYCWGDNRSGQLGDGTTFRRDAPAPVVAPLER
jgi:hypothetical protein